MFSGCENIKGLFLSSFDTKNVKNMEEIIEEFISNLKSLDLSSFNFEKSHEKKFIYNCQSLENLNLSSLMREILKNL